MRREYTFSAPDERHRESEQKSARQAATRPAHWGGYRVRSQALEFWRGRRDCLHDRRVFRKETNNGNCFD